MVKTMNKKDIRILKEKHRIEHVIQESGEVLEADGKSPEILKSRSASGLIVNTKTQTFEIAVPGRDPQTGDVLAWLQHNYAWSFKMALRYLQSRAPDPVVEAVSVPARIDPIALESNDYIQTAIIYTAPETGRKDHAVRVNYDIMDDLQKRAFKISHTWITRCFGKSSSEIRTMMDEYPHRFKATVDFSIDKCACCEEPFIWGIPGAIAYAQEVAKPLSVISDEDLSVYLETEDDIFIDSDFVICESCLRKTYAPRYEALRLCWRSARRREKKIEENMKFF